MPLLMYDGIDVANWPADVTEGLVYTDGKFANMTAARARFPNAQFQTISAVGQVVGDWIDCEPGCVWPPAAAASLYLAWSTKGCRGIYCSLNNEPAVRAACAAIGVTPEFFDANFTGVAHIDAGNVQTQFEDTAGFDVSAIPGGAPLSAIPKMVSASCAWNPTRNGGELNVVMVGADGNVYHMYFTATSGAWSAPVALTTAGA